jgi:hypothetical protein
VECEKAKLMEEREGEWLPKAREGREKKALGEW